MEIQPYISSEDGVLFDVSFNVGDISFGIIELDKTEVLDLFKDIMTQIELLEESYR